MISCELADGRVVQFKNRTRLFIAQYDGMNWSSTNASAVTVEAGDWIGVGDELVRVRRAVELCNQATEAIETIETVP